MVGGKTGRRGHMVTDMWGMIEMEKDIPQPPIAISSSSLYFPPNVKESMVDWRVGGEGYK